jgi:hypothetical protein
MKMHCEQMHIKAVGRRERHIEEVIAQKEYYTDQMQLRKRMKNLLIAAINQENEKIAYLQDWVVLIYFFDIMSSLREHIGQRRIRVDNVERVGFTDQTLATLTYYIFRNKKHMKSKGPTYEVRTNSQAIW